MIEKSVLDRSRCKTTAAICKLLLHHQAAVFVQMPMLGSSAVLSGPKNA